MLKRKQKGKIQKRILRANLILIIIPMIVLAVFAFSQVSLLGGTIGTDGQESIKIEGLRALQNKSSDIVDYIDSWFEHSSVDLDRIITYNEDLFNERINVTGTRLSYHQSGVPSLPKLTYSNRYDKNINISFSDYTNSTNINSSITQLIDKSAYMDYIFNPIYKANSMYVTIIAGYELGITRVFPFINNSRSINQNMNSQDWYIFAKGLNGQTYFGEINQSLIGPAISISKAALYDNNSIIGCCCIEIELSTLREYLSQIKVLKTGYAVLIDDLGKAIIHPDVPDTSLGFPIAELEIDSIEFQSIINHTKNEEQGTEFFQKNGESWVISYTPIGKGGYSIALIVPYREIIESGTNLQNSIAALNAPMMVIFIVVLAILFCVIIFAILRMSKRITRPIKHLTDSIDNMIRGDLTKEIPIDKKRRSNEIGVLAQSFQALLVTMRLGNESYYQGDTYLAFKNYSAALQLFRTTENLKGQGICWNNLGNIFRNWGEFDKAKDAYDKAIKIAEISNDNAGFSSRLNNRGLLYLSEGNFNPAEEDFINALKIDEKMMSNDRIATRKRNLGVLNLLKNDLGEAGKYLNEAYDLDTEISFKANLAEDHFQIGRFELSRKNIDSATHNLNTALSIAEEFGNFPLMINVLKILINIYDEQDNTVLLHKMEAKLAKISELIIRKKDIIFVIDQSGSMEDQNKIRAARKGAKEVFDAVINQSDNVAIVGFHSKVNHILPLTRKSGNVEKIQNVFRDLTNTPYQTAFYDAVGLAVEMLNNSPKENQKWIVALTDGLDNFSKEYSAKTLAEYVTTLDYPLNIILIGVGRELREVFTEMNLIVNSSIRGKYIPIYSESNLSKSIADAFKRVKEIMASSEIEGFSPEEK